MKITEKDVRYIAELAHLRLDDEEVSAYRGEMEQILTYVDKLNELDTESVEPMSHVLASDRNVLREDTRTGSFEHDKALSNAPISGAGHFKVPRVIER